MKAILHRFATCLNIYIIGITAFLLLIRAEMGIELTLIAIGAAASLAAISTLFYTVGGWIDGR